MADYNLGTARGKIEIDASGAKEGARQAEDAVGKVGKSSEGIGRAVGTLGAGLTGAAAVVGAAFAGAVSVAANFQERISAIGAVSGATGAELEAIREKALQLGKDTSFSASEAAQAMEELVKAGLPLDDVLTGAADAAVALAAAGGVDMPEAASQITAAMNAFGIAAKDVGGVADIIAGAANASAIDVGEFGQSLKQVAAVADLAGVSFDDTATAIALLGQAGIKGSDAGTSLKTFLTNLQPTTEKQISLFKELGLMTADGANKFFDATGKLKGLDEISGILNESLGGLTEQQRLMALETLFGSDAIRAAAILTKEGSAGFNEMADSIGKISAADVAAQRLDNVKGRLEALKGSLETAAITIGTFLLPAIQKVIEFFTDLINKFLELSPQTQKIILAVVGITAAIIGVIGVILTVVAVIGAFMAALAPIAGAIGIGVGALAGLIAIVPIVIAAIVLLAILIVKNFDKIKAKAVSIFNAVKGFLVSVWNAIKGALSAALNAIKGVFMTVFNAIKSYVMFVFNVYKTIILTALNVIRSVITAFFAVVKAIFTTALNAIKAVWQAVWSTFGPLIKAILGLIVAIFNLFWTIVKGVFLLALMALKALVTTVFNAIKGVITTVMNAIKAVIQAVWNAIKPIVMAAVNAIKATITTVFNAIKGVVTTIFNAIKGVIQSVFGVIKGVVSAGVGAIKGAIGGLASLVGTVAGFFGKIVGAIRGKIGEAVGIAGSLGSRIAGAVGNLGSLLFGKGQQIIQGLLNGITSMIGKVTGAIKGVTDKIARFLPGSPVKEGPLRVLNRGYAGGQIAKMLASGLERQLPAVQGISAQLSTTILGEVTAPASAVAGPRAAAGAVGGNTYSISKVEIPASDLAEMQGISDFFDRIQQEARRRAPAGSRG